MAGILRIPVNEDGSQHVQPGHAVVLSLGGAIPNLTLATDPQRIFQSVMRLTIVQPDLCAALHICIKQPFNDEQCPFDPANLSQGFGKVMLSRVKGKRLQQLAGWHDAAAMVATARRMSGQFSAINRSLILPPTVPRSSFGGLLDQTHRAVLKVGPGCAEQIDRTTAS